MLNVIEKKYLRQLPHLLGALGVFVVSAALASALYLHKSGRPTTAPIFANAVLVVFEGGDCDPCTKFRRTIARDYAATATAETVPIRYYDLSGGGAPPQRYGLAGGITTGPTAVVFDVYGREAARWAGLPDTAERFEDFVRPHVRRAQRDLAYAAAQGYTN